MTRLIAIIASVVIIALLGVTYFMSGGSSDSQDQFAQCRSSKVAGGSAQIGGPFTLVDENGKTVTDKDVLTKPSLVYFGYTFCPDVCPLDSARNAEVVDILEERGQILQPVLISIDPERDTPEAMKEFTEVLHPRMLGLTGSPEQVKAASKAYRTYYKKQESDDPEYYLVDHSTFSYLMLPGHGFAEFFKRDQTPESMADQIGCFLEKM